ncbi:MAG: ABC transporter substrate-binding protein [Candidatus Margulisiibacteriota bacterium]|nr:MAG: hypothetical protein A2X43_04025 [Candidatus Margulisbacteria bacterium GWD2_39_127]OGI05169.1 MAG: hypothetical protein A2X42_02535 [Candidatus Margulisbacteria bacterium GWF2_38_17]OGI06218.1 MAG: hypothetical protein A2X41_08115 [Candidatus Margulisbacteria bacterium GWE2_39_32]PZM78875.1 MAG: ABC transporter substrate-binding protein [Candidatus Margulisiibacteriota bacterium]HAR64545.1 ABC transporter substrate-binding protein [Candidatus Margulisiibacteriota bacterium]
MELFFKKLVGMALVLSIAIICAVSVTAAQVTEVNMWIMPNSNKSQADLEEVLAKFHREHKDIKVRLTILDWGAAWPKITTAATSGDVPDIVQLGTTWVSSISAMGALEDFSARVNEIGGSSAFLPSSWKTASVEGSDKITAIPWFVDARAMFYRTDVFKKLKIKPSDIDTWEGLELALQKIKDANLVIDGVKVNPLGFTGKNDWNVIHNLAPWIWGAGGEFLTKDNKASAIDSDEVVNGLSYYLGLVRKGFVPLDCLEQNTAQVSTGFDNGQYAIVFDGPYKIKSLTTPSQRGGALDTIAAKRFGILPYPKGPEGQYTFIGGNDLGIFKASKKKDAAWEVVKYLSSPEAQLHYAKLTGYLPATKKALADPYFTKDINRKVYVEVVKNGKTYPTIPAWGLLENVLIRRFGVMWDHLLGSIRK